MSKNMSRRGFLGATAALTTPAVSRGRKRLGLRARLLGAWRLVDAVTVYANGATGPWYDRPGPYTGLIIYDASGAMSVQIASARPPAASPPEPGAMSAAAQLKYLHSYYAYFGRFEVDEPRSEVRHFVTSSLDARETGVTYTQNLSLTRDRLILKTQAWRVRGQLRHSRLTWSRA
jgi:hypothetical protein